jgi:Flp pilus assembly protein TadG
MGNQKISRAANRKGERGNVLAYTVISALFLFLAVGLGVDLSHLYLAKTELQNTADAAALAGASALTLPVESRITTAVDRAIEVMNLNRYNFDNRNYADVMTVEAQRALVTFAVNLDDDYVDEETAKGAPDNIRFVRVQTPSVPVSIFFALPILGSQRNLNARAIAGLSVPGNVNFCPAPLAVIDCGKLGNACVDADGNPVHLGGVCNAGGPHPNPDGTACDPDKQLCRNCVYTIRAEPAGGPAPGNYHGLCCPGQACDAEWIRQRLAGGNNCNECPPIDPGEEITPTTKPGINAGPIRQGINTRFDVYNGGTPPLNPTDHPPDPNIWPPNATDELSWADYVARTQFLAPQHTPQADRRILILPITPFNSWNDANGRSTVTVSSLGGFFLRRRIGLGNDGEIKAEYIGDEVISSIGLTPGGTNTTNIVTPVLYK